MKRTALWRYAAIAAVFLLIGVVYVARLANVQLASRDLYTSVSDNTRTRTVKIQAHRGELYDRNGVPLVTNDIRYDLVLDYAALPQNAAEANETLLHILRAISHTGNDDGRVAIVFPLTGSYPDFSYNTELLESGNWAARFARLLAAHNFDADLTPETFVKKFSQRFGLLDAEGEPLYDGETMTTLFVTRCALELNRHTSADPFLLAENVSPELITYVEEQNLRGADFVEKISRHYHYPGYASHILGMVGKIDAANVEYYTDRGYPMDATVGISGAEQAFEEYLRGQDGLMTIVEDIDGNMVDCYVSREPIPGSNVRLTIDINMQIAAEDALAENIAYIRDKALSVEGDLDGEDASAGALTAINVKTAEIYAIASYPTYNLVTYAEDIASLNTDPNRPLVNRALSGQYPPGSTFKIGVAAAALTEGIITPDTIIEAKGVYTYYAPSYTPRCWYYLHYRASHGNINVVKALQVSCNYFFYEVGRLLTIETMNRYMSSYGIGQATGIELAERTGVLAGPYFRETHARDPWTAGDTLQAAIGQSDNLLTPLQLAVYLSTIANGGTRYSAHLLHSVRTFYEEEVIYAPSPSVAGEAALSQVNYETLMTALKSVTEDDGSAARIFRDYPLNVGGKTGTAQVGENKSANAVFCAFAPWEDPEIAVSCIIEQGGNGTDAGVAVREIFDLYFGLGDYAPAP